MAASPYSRNVDLSDVNDAHSLGVHLVPPGSLVLDVGAADGSVAGALRNTRACRVWAVEKDHTAAEAARRLCERVVEADVEALDLEQAVEGERFDVVLLLDVLEHLRDPEEMLRKAARVLGPGGRIVASIPNVAHASVRLQLLHGRFTRTAAGLLDRTHLHFFDRPSMLALFRAAGLEVLDQLQVTRQADQTEIPVSLESVPPEVLEHVAADEHSETYQFVVTARPAASPRLVGAPASIAEALQGRARRLEVAYRGLEARYRNLEAELTRVNARAADLADENRRLTEGMDAGRREVEARDGLIRAAGAAREELADRATQLERALREAVGAREQLALECRHLALDLSVKDAYVAELRQVLSESEQTLAGAEDAAERQRVALEALRAELSEARAQAAAHRVAAETQAAAWQASRLEVSGYQRTLALPRYAIADRVNNLLKGLGPVHRALKRLLGRPSAGPR